MSIVITLERDSLDYRLNLHFVHNSIGKVWLTFNTNLVWIQIKQAKPDTQDSLLSSVKADLWISGFNEAMQNGKFFIPLTWATYGTVLLLDHSHIPYLGGEGAVVE